MASTRNHRGLGAGYLITIMMFNHSAAQAEPICVRANLAVENVGITPRYSVIEDLDGDGDLDMAVENLSFIILLLNDGTGRLTETSSLELFTDVYGIAGADLDGDGDVDLVVALGLQSKIGVLLNNGDATFSPIAKYLTCSLPFSVAVGDLDGDSMPDVASACGTYPGRIGVNINNGEGTFSTSIGHSTDGDGANCVVLFDMFEDGDLDLAVTNEKSDNVAIFYNDGAGGFTGPDLFETPVYPRSVAAVELGGVGGAELVVSCGEPYVASGELAVLPNTGKGFGPYKVHAYSDNGRFASAGDVDGDGDNDLLGAYGQDFPATSGMVFWQNDGHGDLHRAADIALPQEPYFVGAADMNGDGLLDGVAVSDMAISGTIQVFPNQGSEGFIQPEVLDEALSHFVVADLNGDGYEDIVGEALDSEYVDRIRVRLNKGDGTFGPSDSYDVLFGATTPKAADLDGDTDLDLVVHCEGVYNPIGHKFWYSGIVTFLNAGDGTFDEGSQWLTGDNVSIFDIAVGDFNGDGFPDIIAAQQSPDDLLHYLQNDQSGGFRDTLLTPPLYPNLLHALDLNGDSKPELILNRGNPDDHLNDVYELTSEGQFEWRSTITTSVGDAYTIRSADFDRDGTVDLLITADHYFESELLTLRGLGNFEFGEETVIETPDRPDSILIDQLNGDCYPDLVTANDGGNNILLYPNDGNGRFTEAPVPVIIGTSVGDIAVINPNQDGVKELYVGFESTKIMILESCETGIPVSCLPCEGDTNSDGTVDPLDSGYILSRFGCLVNSGDAACDAADVNGDGMVDPLDAGYVLSRLGECP